MQYVFSDFSGFEAFVKTYFKNYKRKCNSIIIIDLLNLPSDEDGLKLIPFNNVFETMLKFFCFYFYKFNR